MCINVVIMACVLYCSDICSGVMPASTLASTKCEISAARHVEEAARCRGSGCCVSRRVPAFVVCFVLLLCYCSVSGFCVSLFHVCFFCVFSFFNKLVRHGTNILMAGVVKHHAAEAGRSSLRLCGWLCPFERCASAEKYTYDSFRVLALCMIVLLYVFVF